MAEQTPETAKDESASATKEKGGMLKKLLVFGVPTFFVQLVVIYFLTAKFIVPMTAQHQLSAGSPKPAAQSGESMHAEAEPEESESSEPKEQFIFVVKDLIINPSGTNGQRYLLSTIAFNLSSEEAMKAIEKKEMAVRDMLNSTLTAKTMEQLIDVSNRENLRQEIAEKTKKLLNSGKLVSVYFSKYVIQ